MTSPPKSLFKYFSHERLGVLRNLCVRYTPLGAFNDPFEGRPDIPALASPEQMKKVAEEARRQILNEMYLQLPSHVRASFGYTQWELSVGREIDKKISGSSLKSASFTFIQQFMSQSDQYLGAFCLSEVPDSLLMWSHYGNSHSGFALEFDAQHSHFDERRDRDDTLRHLRRVEYRRTRHRAYFSDLNPFDMFYIKSDDWSYEREWRIFRALEDADTEIPGDPYSTHLFSFPAEALRSVILGARATQQTAASIEDALRENQELGHVKLHRARVDDSHFLLRIED